MARVLDLDSLSRKVGRRVLDELRIKRSENRRSDIVDSSTFAVSRMARRGGMHAHLGKRSKSGVVAKEVRSEEVVQFCCGGQLSDKGSEQVAGLTCCKLNSRGSSCIPTSARHSFSARRRKLAADDDKMQEVSAFVVGERRLRSLLKAWREGQ